MGRETRTQTQKTHEVFFCTFSCSLVHTIWTDRPKRKTKCLPTTCKEGRWLCPPQFPQHSPLMTILIIVWKNKFLSENATNACNVHQSRQTHTNWQSLEKDQRESTHYHHNQQDHHQVHHDHHNIKSWPAPDKVSWLIIRRSERVYSHYDKTTTKSNTAPPIKENPQRVSPGPTTPPQLSTTA